MKQKQSPWISITVSILIIAQLKGQELGFISATLLLSVG